MSEPVVLQAAADAVAPMGDQCRYLWNLFLAESIERHRAEKKFNLSSISIVLLIGLSDSMPKCRHVCRSF